MPPFGIRHSLCGIFLSAKRCRSARITLPCIVPAAVETPAARQRESSASKPAQTRSVKPLKLSQPSTGLSGAASQAV